MYNSSFTGDGNYIYKYNEGQNYSDSSPVLATVDTLKLTYSGTYTNFLSGFDEVGYNTHVSRQQPDLKIKMNGRFAPMDVLIKNVVFGSLTFSGKGHATLSVLNSQFYTNPIWPTGIELFNKESGLLFSNIRELHIAVDTYDLIPRYNYCYFTKKGATYFDILPYGHVTNKGLLTTSFRLGSINSKYYFQVYDKQPEVLENKVYIADFWALNGLIISKEKNVHRVELRYKKKVPDLFARNLGKLTNQQFLLGAFRMKGEKWLRFKLPVRAQKHKGRWPQLHLIDWSSLPPSIQIMAAGVAKTETKYSKKIALKTFYKGYLETGSTNLLDANDEICYGDSELQEYYERKKPEWKKEAGY